MSVPVREDNVLNYDKLYDQYIMLSDEVRNKAFWKALSLLNISDKNVLDVGSGTGLLSIFAIKNKAKKVYACEISDAYKYSEIIINDSLTTEEKAKIKVIHKNIIDCTLEDFDNEKVDIILSEWMGICLFHERMLEPVLFARDHFLKEGGMMLPESADLMACLIDNENNDKEEIDASLEFWKTNGESEEQDFQKLYGINLKGLSQLATSEKFKSLFIHTIDDDHTISDRILSHYDLKTVKIEDIQKTALSGEFHAKRNGNVAGVCFSFRVSFGKDISLSTYPGKDTHWGQAVLYLDEPIKIKKKYTFPFNLDLSIESGTTYKGVMSLTIKGGTIVKEFSTEFEE